MKIFICNDPFIIQAKIFDLFFVITSSKSAVTKYFSMYHAVKIVDMSTNKEGSNLYKKRQKKLLKATKILFLPKII